MINQWIWRNLFKTKPFSPPGYRRGGRHRGGRHRGGGGGGRGLGGGQPLGLLHRQVWILNKKLGEWGNRRDATPLKRLILLEAWLSLQRRSWWLPGGWTTCGWRCSWGESWLSKDGHILKIPNSSYLNLSHGEYLNCDGYGWPGMVNFQTMRLPNSYSKGNTIHIQTIQHMFHGPHGEKKGSPSPWFRAVEVMVVLVVEVLVLVVVVVVVVNWG